MQIEHLIALLGFLFGSGGFITAIAALRTVNGQRHKLEAEAEKAEAEAEAAEGDAADSISQAAQRVVVLSKEKVDELISDNTALKADRNGLEQKIDVLIERVKGCEAYKVAAEFKFSEQAQDIRDLTQALADIRHEKDELERTLNNKIARLEKQNGELNAQVQGFRALAIRLHAGIDELRKDLNERNARISHLEQQVSERDGRISHLEQQIAERDRVRADLQRQITGLRAQIDRVEETVANGKSNGPPTEPQAGGTAPAEGAG